MSERLQLHVWVGEQNIGDFFPATEEQIEAAGYVRKTYEGCYCSEYQSSGLPCLPGQCPNVPWKSGVHEQLASEVIVNTGKEMDEALSKPSLAEALAHVAVADTERAIRQAFRNARNNRWSGAHGGLWDTCFLGLFNEVLRRYPSQLDAWQCMHREAVDRSKKLESDLREFVGKLTESDVQSETVEELFEIIELEVQSEYERAEQLQVRITEASKTMDDLRDRIDRIESTARLTLEALVTRIVKDKVLEIMASDAPTVDAVEGLPYDQWSARNPAASALCALAHERPRDGFSTEEQRAFVREHQGAIPKALDRMLENARHYLGELPDLVSRHDYSEMLHHAGHIESEMRDVGCLIRLMGAALKTPPAAGAPDAGADSGGESHREAAHGGAVAPDSPAAEGPTEVHLGSPEEILRCYLEQISRYSYSPDDMETANRCFVASHVLIGGGLTDKQLLISKHKLALVLASTQVK